MLKRITLFLFMVFNLNIYSQVVIKDEVILTYSTDEYTLIFNKPGFPGRIYWELSYYNLGILKESAILNQPAFTINIGEHTILSTSLDCQRWGPNIFNNGFVFANGTFLPPAPVSAALLNCVVYGGEPVNVPLSYDQFIDENIIKYNIVNGNTLDMIGSIWYIPDACNNVSLCQQPFGSPELNIYHIPDEERCNDTVDAAGVFRGLYWELREGEEFALTECQDQMTGNVKFKYATNFSQEIDLPYNLEICPDNVAHYNPTRIDNLQEFEDVYIDNLSTIDPNEACQLRGSIIRQQGIDANGEQTGAQMFFQNGIWLTAITLAHEEQHKTDYEKALNDPKAINIFYDYYKDYSIPCSTYSADPDNAKLVAENSFMAKLIQFSDEAKTEYESKLNEVELHGRDAVQDTGIPYLERLDEFIVDNFGETVYEQILKTCK